MRFVAILLSALALPLVGTPVMAQDDRYESALRQMLAETADGNCPEDIMGAELLAACRQQIQQMSAGLASLGEVESLRLLRTEARPTGRIEIYEVRFATGQTLTWGIGGLSDGKFNVAYTTG